MMYAYFLQNRWKSSKMWVVYFWLKCTHFLDLIWHNKTCFNSLYTFMDFFSRTAPFLICNIVYWQPKDEYHLWKSAGGTHFLSKLPVSVCLESLDIQLWADAITSVMLPSKQPLWSECLSSVGPEVPPVQLLHVLTYGRKKIKLVMLYCSIIQTIKKGYVFGDFIRCCCSLIGLFL